MVVKTWSLRQGSNLRPAVYKTAALPTELQRRGTLAGLEPATVGVNPKLYQLSYEGKELVVNTFLRSDTTIISVLMVTHDRNGV